MITQELLHSLFEYKDGILYSKIDRFKTCIRIGSPIGNICLKGYVRTCINYKTYKVHRLIFMMFYGYMPTGLDHINGIKTDNRIENLREATLSENQWNKTKTKRNTSGFKGITLEDGRWRVRIGLNRKNINIGVFDDIELAELVAIEARNKYHGNFAKH